MGGGFFPATEFGGFGTPAQWDAAAAGWARPRLEIAHIKVWAWPYPAGGAGLKTSAPRTEPGASPTQHFRSSNPARRQRRRQPSKPNRKPPTARRKQPKAAGPAGQPQPQRQARDAQN